MCQCAEIRFACMQMAARLEGENGHQQVERTRPGTAETPDRANESVLPTALHQEGSQQWWCLCARDACIRILQVSCTPQYTVSHSVSHWVTVMVHVCRAVSVAVQVLGSLSAVLCVLAMRFELVHGISAAVSEYVSDFLQFCPDHVTHEPASEDGGVPAGVGRQHVHSCCTRCGSGMTSRTISRTLRVAAQAPRSHMTRCASLPVLHTLARCPPCSTLVVAPIQYGMHGAMFTLQYAHPCLLFADIHGHRSENASPGLVQDIRDPSLAVPKGFRVCRFRI